METPFAILAGLFFAAAIYLMLSRHIIRIMLGVALLGNGAWQALGTDNTDSMRFAEPADAPLPPLEY